MTANRLSSRRPRRPAPRLFVSAAAVLLALGACSSGGTDDAAPENSGDSSDAVAYAEEQIASYLERAVSQPDLDPPIPVTEPLETLPTGKSFVFVQCGVPECAFLAEQSKIAADVVGAELTVVQAGNDAQSTADAFATALDLRPDVIIQAAIDPALWTSQLNAINDAGIPVVAWTIPDPNPEGITVSFNGSDGFAAAGRLMADYVIAESGGAGHAVIFWPPEFTVFQGLAEGFQQEIEENCPDCSVEVQQAPASEIGSQLPGRVVSYLQANPDTDWVAGAFGSMLIGVPQALRAAGIGEGVQTISQAGGQVNFQYLQDGLQTVDLSNDIRQEAWLGIDIASRLSTGQDVDPQTPGARTAQQFLTQDDVDFNPEDGYSSSPGFEDYFKQLWGV